MLDKTVTSTPPAIVKGIDGHKLSRQLRKGKSPTFRDLRACNFWTGEVRVCHLSPGTRTYRCKCYLSTVGRMSCRRARPSAAGRPCCSAPEGGERPRIATSTWPVANGTRPSRRRASMISSARKKTYPAPRSTAPA